MKKMVGFLIAVLAVWALPNVAAAVPTYVAGNTCPNPLGGSDRQYQVTQATNCVWDTTSNIQGTTTEANTYLNAPAAQPTWGTGWVGLGSTGTGCNATLSGFSCTTDAGNDDGTFSINTAILNYGQFALGLKDGGDPKWAIFLLPAGTFSGDWHFLTEAGDLSHFVLYGRDPGTPSVPEGSTVILLGLALVGFAFFSRQLLPRA